MCRAHLPGRSRCAPPPSCCALSPDTIVPDRPASSSSVWHTLDLPISADDEAFGLLSPLHSTSDPAPQLYIFAAEHSTRNPEGGEGDAAAVLQGGGAFTASTPDTTHPRFALPPLHFPVLPSAPPVSLSTRISRSPRSAVLLRTALTPLSTRCSKFSLVCDCSRWFYHRSTH
jgi:hypothetical protein